MMNGTLALHCGGQRVTRDMLADMPSPEPRGGRHFPVRFDSLVGEVTRGLHEAGTVITEEAFGIARNDSQLFGLIALESPASKFALTIGLRSSVDQSLPISLAVGGRTFVCDNMAFSASFALATKSTTNVMERLPKLVNKALEFLLPWQNTIANETEKWAQDPMPDWGAERLMIAAVRTGTVPGSKLAKWIEEYDSPSAPEHAEYKGTRLGLHHAATAALRPVKEGISLDTTVKRTMDLRSMFLHPLDQIDEWEAPRKNGCLELTDKGWRERGNIRQIQDAELVN